MRESVIRLINHIIKTAMYMILTSLIERGLGKLKFSVSPTAIRIAVKANPTNVRGGTISDPICKTKKGMLAKNKRVKILRNG